MKAKSWWKIGVILAASVFLFGACEEDDDSFKVIGTSGGKVDMAGKWNPDCVPDIAAGDSERNIVKVSDGKGTFSEDKYLSVVDCTGTADISIGAKFSFTLDSVVANITWEDDTGSIFTAPTGLELVTTANGMTFTIDSITQTPNTAAGTFELNDNVECELTDWATGVTKDVLACFIGTDPNPAKESWVVDDSAKPLKWYTGDDTGTADTAGYPTVIESFDPELK